MAGSRASARMILGRVSRSHPSCFNFSSSAASRGSSFNFGIHTNHDILRHTDFWNHNALLYTLPSSAGQFSRKDMISKSDYGFRESNHSIRVSDGSDYSKDSRYKVNKNGPATNSFVCKRGLSSQASSAVLSGSEAVKYTLPSESLNGNSLLETIRFYGGCYWQLSKARLSMLVVSTAGAGYVMGSGAVVDWTCLGWTCLGTMMAAASANSFNQILEVENDALMKRTMRRPLPSGRLSFENALAWAITNGIGGVGLLAFQTNSLVAALGAANILLYTLVYTPLKQIHPVNTWVGAVVGAIPPLMGWAAATGQLNLGAWVLAAVLYFWQIPHFMALATLCSKDYAAGGYKMLFGQRAALIALRNCLYLLPIGFVAQHLELTSGFFSLECLLLSACMGITAAKFYFTPTGQKARQLFRASLLYLPFLMGAMLIHRLPNLEQQEEHAALASFGSETHGDDMIIYSEECPDKMKFDDRDICGCRSRPPIALVSIAPFPFLPAPEYHTSFR